MLLPCRPGRQHASIDRALLVMRSGQIACAHQKLPNDLSADEFEVFPEELHPIRFRKGMVLVEPGFERAVALPKLADAPGVFDRRIYLKAISDDAGVIKQPPAIFVAERCDRFDLEIRVRPPKTFSLLQYGFPG